ETQKEGRQRRKLCSKLLVKLRKAWDDKCDEKDKQPDHYNDEQSWIDQARLPVALWCRRQGILPAPQSPARSILRFLRERRRLQAGRGTGQSSGDVPA